MASWSQGQVSFIFLLYSTQLKALHFVECTVNMLIKSMLVKKKKGKRNENEVAFNFLSSRTQLGELEDQLKGSWATVPFAVSLSIIASSIK